MLPHAVSWLRALRPLAVFNIWPMLFFGFAMSGVAWTCNALLGWVLFALLWGMVDQWFIVLANDYADKDSDSDARTLFSGGSGVIVDGTLSASAVGRASILCYVVLLLLSLLAVSLGRPLVPLAWLASGALVHAYSYSPLRLSHRGGGSLLQGLGVGVVLPLLGAYLVDPTLAHVSLSPLIITFLLGVAGNITTALPDLDADRKAAKRTLAVWLGPRSAAWAASVLVCIAAGCLSVKLPALACALLAIFGAFCFHFRQRPIEFVIAEALASTSLVVLFVFTNT